MALIASLVYWPSVSVLNEAWTDFVNITSTHGYLMVAVALALLFRDRRGIAYAPPHWSPLACALLVAGSTAWLICYRAAIQDLHVVIYPALIGLATATAFGWRVARFVVVPLGLIYCAVPAWGEFNPPLQWVTVRAVRGMMWATGVPGTVVGNVIQIPYGSFEVEGGCSGMHFLVVGIAVALLHGELRNDAFRVRIAQLGLVAALAMIANWIRVYVIVLAGYLTHMRTALVTVSHYWFGWEVFAVVLAAFLWLAGRVSRIPYLAACPGTEGVAMGPPFRCRARWGTAVLALVAVPGMCYALKSVAGEPTALRVRFPAIGTDWSGPATAAQWDWHPVFPGADDSRQVAYQSLAGGHVEAFAAVYRSQRQGAELVGSGSSLTGEGSPLRTVGIGRVASSAGDFNEMRVIDSSGSEWLIWSRYQIGKRFFVTPLAEQLWYGAATVASDPMSAVLALRAQCLPTCDAARQLLLGLAERPLLQVVWEGRK
jgi:exosortase